MVRNPVASLNKTSILARKLTSVQATVTTKVDFTPLSYQHTAGLILYYDNMNFVYLYKYFSDTLNHSAISVMQVENGIKREFSGKDFCGRWTGHLDAVGGKRAENPVLSGRWMEIPIKKSDHALILRNFRMSILSLVNLQELS